MSRENLRKAISNLTKLTTTSTTTIPKGNNVPDKPSILVRMNKDEALTQCPEADLGPCLGFLGAWAAAAPLWGGSEGSFSSTLGSSRTGFSQDSEARNAGKR